MGVPKFFRWLSERYPKINQPLQCDLNPKTRAKYFDPADKPIPTATEIINNDGYHLTNNNNGSSNNNSDDTDTYSEFTDPTIPEFDRLYIDMNGIIHGCSHNNSTDQQSTTSNSSQDNNDDENNKIKNITEEQIFANISFYLDRVISDIVKPKELVYMAIDGVAPRAKMNQQRSRRFRSGKVSEIAMVQKQNMEKEKQMQQQQQNRFFQNENEDEYDYINDDDYDEDDTMFGLDKNKINNTGNGTTITMEMDGNDLVTTSTGGFAGTIQTGQLEQKYDDIETQNITTKADALSQYSTMLAPPGIQKDSSLSMDGKENTNDYDDDDEHKFHHNSITPGTPFLDRCSNHIQNFVRHKLQSGDPAWKNLKIIFSGPNVPGEGEHKIMDFIREEQRLEQQNSSSSDNDNYMQRKRHCLMGQDGDLIMLGLATHELNFCLLREKVYFGGNSNPSPFKRIDSVQNSIMEYTHNSQFELLHLNVLRDYLAYEFETKNIVPESPFLLEHTIDDFVFLTFFVGNDFLPHIPALDIGDNAFDLLFNKYKKHRSHWIGKDNQHENSRKHFLTVGPSEFPYLTRSGEIVDGKRLEIFLMDVGRYEDPYLNWKKKITDKTYKYVRENDLKHGRKYSVPSKIERDTIEHENRKKYRKMLEDITLKTVNDTSTSENSNHQERINHTPVLTSKSMPTITFIPEEEEEEDEGVFSQFARFISDSLSPSSRKKDSYSNSTNIQYQIDEDDMTDLKGRYYYDKFNFTPLDIQKHHALRTAYIKGLVWNLKYYYQGCVSWEWHYPYHYGPMLSDLKDISSILDSIRFKKGKPLRPFEQLLACMPPNSSHVLPKPYQFLMTDKEKSPIVEYYPEDFFVDMNGKRNPWEAVVLLPFIDGKKLISAVNNLVDTNLLTDDEVRRNQLGKSCTMFLDEKSNLSEVITDEQSSAQDPFQIPSYLNEGTNATIENLYPGFSTLHAVPISTMDRTRFGLNIFGTKSRYKTSTLNMDMFYSTSLPPVYVLGKKFIGTSVYFRFPYFQEGFVTALSDSGGRIRGHDNYHPWENDDLSNEWKQFADKLHSSYKRGDGTVGSGGWNLLSNDSKELYDLSTVEEDKLIISLRPLKYLQRLQNGEVVKVYDKNEIHVPFISAIWHPHKADSRLNGIRSRLEKDPYNTAVDLGGNIGGIPTNEGMRSQRGKLGADPMSPILPPLDSDHLSNGNSSQGLPPLGSIDFTKSSLEFSYKNKANFSTLLRSHKESPRCPTDKQNHSFSSLASIGSKRSLLAAKQRDVIPIVHNRHSLSTLSLQSSYRSSYFNHHRLLGQKSGKARTIAVLALSLFLSGDKSWFLCAKAESVSQSSPISSISLQEDRPYFDKNNFHQQLFSIRCGYTNIDEKLDGEDSVLFESKSPPPLEFAHGTTTISFKFSGGIIAAVDSRASMGNFVGSKTTQKVLPINKHILGTMAGGAADCTFWIRKLQSYAALHSLSTRHSMTVARASRLLSDFLYQNRQLDLSVGTMIMGFDSRGASIYYVDNTGMRMNGDIFAVGSGSTFALGILDSVSRRKRWKMTEEEAVELGIRAIRHATFRDAGSGGYIGVYLITKKDGWKKVFSEDLALISDNMK